MSIRVAGDTGGRASLYRRAARFFKQRLLGDDAWRCRVSINFTRRLGEDNDAEICYETKRNLRIRVRPGMSKEYSLRALAHEMVHAKQIFRGELRLVSGPPAGSWMGKSIVGERYEDLPWEREARSMETRLVKAFKRHDGESGR